MFSEVLRNARQLSHRLLNFEWSIFRLGILTYVYLFFQAQYAMLIDIAHNVVLYTEPKKKVR